MQKPYSGASALKDPLTRDRQFNVCNDEFDAAVYFKDGWIETDIRLRDGAGVEIAVACGRMEIEPLAADNDVASEISMPSNDIAKDIGHRSRSRSSGLPSSAPKNTVILCGESPATERDLCEYLSIHPAFSLLSSVYDRDLAGALFADARPDLLVLVASRLSPEDVSFVRSCSQSCPESVICVLFEAAEPVIEHQILATGAMAQELEFANIDALAHVIGRLKGGTPAAIEDPYKETPSETIELSDLDRATGLLLGLGWSIRSIAATLDLDIASVLRHREALRTALCCATVAELTALLARYLI